MSKQPLTRVLVIGLDSGEPSLIKEWAGQGLLPNLAKLMQKSTCADVKNPKGMESGAVWPTFHTAKLPGHYAQHDALRTFDPDTYGYHHLTYDDLPKDNLWQRLSREGKRCCVIDSPYVPLDPEINGTMIVDYALHVPSQGYGVGTLQTFPPDVREEVLDVAGPDPFCGEMCDDQHIVSPRDFEQFVDNHLVRIRQKAKVTAHFLKKGNWDYFETVFCDLHCIGHRAWHIADRTHPQYDARYEEKLGNPYQRGLIEFDRQLGELLHLVDERTLTLLYASHGMGPQHSATGLLDRMLEALESGQGHSNTENVKRSLKKLWQSTPPEFRSLLEPIKRPFHGALTPRKHLGNSHERRFFEVYNTQRTGGVRLNLMGREAQGVVAPEDYDTVLNEIIEGLTPVVNAETGTPLVVEFIKTREHYDGDFVAKFPDLLVKWDDRHPITRVASDRIGTLRQDYEILRTGDHTSEGMFAAHGRGVAATQLNNHVAAQDLSRTLLALLGASTADCDGETIPALTNFAASPVPAE